MKIFQKKGFDVGQITFFILLVSCLYIWPFRIVWLDKVAIAIAFALFIRKKELLNLIKYKRILLPVIMVIYFLIRDLSTLFENHTQKNIKVFFVHIILLLIFLIRYKINLEYTRVYVIFMLYSIFSILTYLLFFFIGLRWEEAQGEKISGSLIFSIPFALAAILIACTIENTNNKKEKFLLILILTNGIIFQSRTTLLLVFLCLALITIKSNITIQKRIQIVSPFLILVILSSFYTGTFNSVSKSESSNFEQENSKRINSYLIDIKDSALLLIQNRESDSDRVNHLKCGFKFIQERNFGEKWFGTGANSYRHEIEKCSEFGGDDEIDSRIQYIGSGSKSISLTILIVDYGLAGLVLLIVSVIINLRNQKKKNQWYDAVITILSAYVFCLSNVNDVMLTWITLVFSFGITDIRKNRV
jgi:hypothetical protein